MGSGQKTKIMLKRNMSEERTGIHSRQRNSWKRRCDWKGVMQEAG